MYRPDCLAPYTVRFDYRVHLSQVLLGRGADTGVAKPHLPHLGLTFPRRMLTCRAVRLAPADEKALFVVDPTK